MLAGLAFFGGHAQAQDAAAPTAAAANCDAKAKPDTCKAEPQATEVVITGSRIRNKEFTSTSPIQVITSERSTLLGFSDTTKILQSSTVSESAGQINNEFTGFVTVGGPGANTISLRGLGANRTLILLNGHRVGPSGVRGQVGPADLSTIPASLIDRIDILKDGASSIYGSDAVAGVINIITKKVYNGGVASVTLSVPSEKGGQQIQGNLSQGFMKDRFHGVFSYDYYEAQALTQGERKYMACPADYVFDPATGARADLMDTTPGGAGGFRCNILRNNEVDNLSTGRNYVYDTSAVNGGGPKSDNLNGLRRVGAVYTGDAAATRFSQGQTPVFADKFENRTILSPSRRQSANFFGGYDLDSTTEIYGELMYNERLSDQRSWRQIFPTVSQTNPGNPFRTGNPNGYTPGSARSIIAVPSVNDQKVEYLRANIGVRGDLPDFSIFKNWTYDVSAQQTKSTGYYGGNFYYNDRVVATTSAGTACNAALMTIAPAPCPTTPVDYFSPNVVANGFSAADQAFLMGYETGKTTYQQSYVEANFTGDLFKLPAGTASGAFGFMWRKETLNDTPGPQAIANNYWGSTTSGITKGSDTIKEIYAELELPLIKGGFLSKKVDLDLSGRASDYKSYGKNSTYKVGLNWAINDAWRVRASQGTSFRAPALYELFLANQSGFLSQASIDPCFQYGSSGTTSTVQTNCAAQGIPNNYTAVGSSSATVTTGGGVGFLHPETATTKTLGIIYTPGWSKLQIDADYFETVVNNEVANYGAANILFACYNSPNMTSPFCSLFNRDLGATSVTKFMITTVKNNYVNISKQYQRGVDLTISYSHNFKFAKFTFDNHNSFITNWSTTQFPGGSAVTNLGFVGFPRYVGDANFRFDRGSYTLNWDVNMVGHSSDLFWFGTDLNTNYASTGTSVHLVRYANFYADHTVSLRKKFDHWAVVATVQNVFNKQPPQVSTGGLAAVNRLGTAPLTSQYDLYGRTFVLNVLRKW